MAQTWAVWAIKPTTVLFIYLFLICLISIQQQSFALLQSEYDGKLVSLINIDVDGNAKSACLSW